MLAGWVALHYGVQFHCHYQQVGVLVHDQNGSGDEGGADGEWNLAHLLGSNIAGNEFDLLRIRLLLVLAIS